MDKDVEAMQRAIGRLLTVRRTADMLAYTPDSLRDPRVQERLGLRPIRLGRAIRFAEADVLRVMDPEAAR
jgi:hypothetical protein